jgi:ABC-type iron transport system FetAB ATPase subunit
MSWVINHLSVKGVKGILDRAGDFDLAGGKSIAIYAPNAYGKSGYADAVEYLIAKKEGSMPFLMCLPQRGV